MKAMILAAGRGTRLRPITDYLPKPLLPVAGKPLIAHHLDALARAGIDEIVINISHFADQIKEVLGNGENYGVQIAYSYEPEPLETGGGIYQALPLLGPDPFIVVSGDIWTDYPFLQLANRLEKQLAHLVLVDNPSFKPQGDFVLQNGVLHNEGMAKLTYANIGIYHPDLFAHCDAKAFPLGNLLRSAVGKTQVSGEHYQGDWANIGTVQEWYQLTQRVGML